MRLTQQTDVALRILLFLAMHPDEAFAVKEIGRRFRVPEGFASKTAKLLVREGLLVSRRGRSGGVALAASTHELRLGELLRRLEPIEPLACLHGEGDCPILPVCALKGVLGRATEAFFEVLDGYKLVDLVKNEGQLQRLLQLGPRAPRAA